MIRASFLLAVVVVLIAAARSFLPEDATQAAVGSGGALAFGFVLLAAMQAGTIFGGVRLPRLTGYLACGFLAGPSVLNFVTEDMVKDLKLVNGVAIGIIALSAGSELNFKRLRGKFRAIFAISGSAFVFAVGIISLAALAMGGFLDFMIGKSLVERAVIALTMGVVLSALSPTVTLALISETGAAGPISETVLGVVVVADLFIVIAFAAVNALASATFPSSAASGGGFGELAVHIFGSIAMGAVVGVILAVYVKKVNQRIALFVFGMCFLCAEAGTRLHLDPLLMCLTAGLFVENLTDIEGSKLIGDIESASMPVFALFFAVAGAGLHWHVLKQVFGVAVALVLVRAAALFLGGRVGMALGAVVPAHRRFLPYGLLSQSGVAIGLCVLVGKHFAGWGEQAATCLLGAVMINELVGPVLFRSALVRSGEAGKRAAVLHAH